MKILYKSLFILSFALLWNCDDEFDNPVEEITITSGDADFSNYVALGNSLTAGFADNALYTSGQQNSYPAIIAGQMSAAGGGEFSIPLMPDDIGGFSDLWNATGQQSFWGKLTLQVVEGSLAPVPSTPQSAFASSIIPGLYNNMGVPGAKSYHLLAPGYGNPAGVATGQANPYFARFATSGTTSVLADAAAQQPTFFTLWIGNNDVLGYATAGGDGVNQAGNFDPSTYGGSDISDPNVVANAIEQIVSTMAADLGAKGAIANIPDVASTPFFTTIPYNPVPLDEATAGQLNAGYATYNGALDQLVGQFPGFTQAEADARKITFVAGQNPVVFIDNNLTNLTVLNPALVSMRQATEGELVLLTAQSQLGQQVGVTSPLPSRFVLTTTEITNIETATTAINTAIEQIADNYLLAHVDANTRLDQLSSESGINFNGVNYNATFVTGGAFSLDGIHLTQRGYAIVSNLFIDAINAKFGSSLRHVNPNNYSGVQLP